MIKGIIFDLDGTTMDTIFDIQNCINEVFEEYGYKKTTYDEVRVSMNNGFRHTIHCVVPKGTSEELEKEIGDKYINLYNQKFYLYTKPYEGIKELLEELQNRNILLAANSNKEENLASSLFEKKLPTIKFINVYGRKDGVPQKPDPYEANLLIKEMNLKKEEVLYVGDSKVDYQTACNAELKFIGCAWGFSGKQFLIDIGVENIIDKPNELLNYL